MRAHYGFVALLAGAALSQPALAQAEAGGLAPGSRPNILLIVADDLGYQDIGAFGSEIRTPHIDALVGSGVTLTNFYTSVACQPTRAMLMSGTGNTAAGVGTQGVSIPGNPNYLNHLSDRVVTLADRMRAAGYHTYMAGKWHLGMEDGQTPADRGFERSFILLEPGASHWADMLPFGPNAGTNYRDDGAPVEALPADFYSTIYYTDRAIEYVTEASQSDEPFFAYLAYTTPHWPIHALDEDMEKTRGNYDEGWDVLREQRFARWKELGWAPEDAAAPNLVHTYQPWDSLSDEEKARQARTMEAYAAMVERFDTEIGRLVAHLEEIGERDNTLILFMSDNGAEYMGNDWGGGMAEYFQTFDNRLENIGRPGSYVMPGPGWGEAGAASFYLTKGFLADGGIHVPAFVNAPGLGLGHGRSDAVIAAFDLLPTFVELAGGDLAYDGGVADPIPVTGRSFTDVLLALPGSGRGAEDIVTFAHGGQRAARLGDWKALWMGPPNGVGGWQLFDLAVDPGETTDVAVAHPEMLARLTAAWDRYAEASGVLIE